MKLLLTGFEPFLQFRVNSSWEAIRALDGQHVGPYGLICHRLPVSFGQIDGVLDTLLKETRPDAVLAFGLAPTMAMRLERVALNIDWSERPDNDGRLQPETPIVSHGALALPSPLPLARFVHRLRGKGFPAGLSFHAGTYLCNHVYYRFLQTGLPAAFIHLPPVSFWWPRRRLAAAARMLVASTAAWL
ncbi:MAG: pyroglutamyl-peptidase I [Candidatus Xenobia bacterium]